MTCVCRADLDPIYYCELIDGCLIKDDGDAKITSFTVTPTKVTQGGKHYNNSVCLTLYLQVVTL